MTAHLRYILGYAIVWLADSLASSCHAMCHAGAWLMDIDIDENCAACAAIEDEPPTDGPWAI